MANVHIYKSIKILSVINNGKRRGKENNKGKEGNVYSKWEAK